MRGAPLWDAPLRLFHWALAALVVFSYITAKLGGSWMEWHMRSGYSILTLLLFRIAWGFAGSGTARFTGFVRGPRAAIEYVRAWRAGRRPRVVGHNPLGGWMVLAFLAILLTQAVSGLFVDDEIATQGPLAVKVSNATVSRMSQVHDFNEWLIVGAVALHLLAIAIYQWGLKANLIGPMVHGGELPMGIDARRGSGAAAAVILAIAAGTVYYLVVIFPRTPA
jgi:cytochrome b